MNAKRVLGSLMVLGFALFLGGCNITSASKQKEADYREQGIALMDASKYEEAAEMFQLALDQSVGFVTELDIDICYYKAAAQFASSDYTGAIETYTNIIDYDGDAWEAYYLRGLVYLEASDEDSAVSDFDEAVSKDKKDYDLYIHIYENLYEVYPDKAVEYLNAALEIDGSSAAAKSATGYIYYLLGNVDSATANLTEAVNENEESAFYYLAMVDMDLGDYQTALTLVEQGLALEDGGAYTRELSYAQIVCYEYLSEFETAKSLMETYLETYPSDTKAIRENTFLQTR